MLDPVIQKKNDRVKEGRVTKRELLHNTARSFVTSRKPTTRWRKTDATSRSGVQELGEDTFIAKDMDDVSFDGKSIFQSRAQKEPLPCLDPGNDENISVPRVTRLSVSEQAGRNSKKRRLSEPASPEVQKPQALHKRFSAIVKAQQNIEGCLRDSIGTLSHDKRLVQPVLGRMEARKYLHSVKHELQSRRSLSLEEAVEEDNNRKTASAPVILQTSTLVHHNFNRADTRSHISAEEQHTDSIPDTAASSLGSVVENAGSGLDIDNGRHLERQTEVNYAMSCPLGRESICWTEEYPLSDDLQGPCFNEENKANDTTTSVAKNNGVVEVLNSKSSTGFSINGNITITDLSSKPRGESTSISPNCIGVEDYIRNIRVFLCLRDPEVIAHNLSMWEDRHSIEQIIDNNIKLDSDRYIPQEAKFMVIAEDLIWSPIGSVVYFATQGLDGMYDLKFGFYYSYRNLPDCNIYSLSEWADTECTSLSLISPYETIGRNRFQWGRFEETHRRMVKAVDGELERRKTRAKLRNVGRPRAWRVRSAVIPM
jgi:hypothetical protein